MSRISIKYYIIILYRLLGSERNIYITKVYIDEVINYIIQIIKVTEK